MKIALVSPPTTVAMRYPKGHPLRKGVQVVEPLGLAYLAAMVDDLADVEIVDCILEDLDLNECVDRVKNCDLVGLSSVTSNAHIVDALASRIKQVNPECKVIIGGIHASLYPWETMRNKCVDAVVVGEGEHTFRELIENRTAHLIRGVVFREGSKLVETEPRPLEKDLDTFPFPARDLLRIGSYTPFLFLKKPIAALFASRGCPYRCTFCCKMNGFTYRSRNPEKVVDEIRLLVDEFGCREVTFLDGMFGLRNSWVKSLCRRLIEERLDVVWSCMTRVNVVDEERLRLEKRAGCWMHYYGIETGSPEIMKNIKKDISLQQVRRSVEMTNRAGIKSWGSFMFALPGETPLHARETLDFAKSLKLDFASFHLTTPYRGTELYATWEKYGKLDENLEEYTQLHPVFIPDGWSGREEELEQFYRKAFKEFYLRPSYIAQELLRCRSLDELWLFASRFKSVF